MSEKSYPEFDPAWVEHPEDGSWSLMWLDADGKPSEPIGVDRECDVPGMHTPGASAAIQAISLAKQQERMWTSLPASP